MNLHPARYEGEPFTDYKVRRSEENKDVLQHLRGSLTTDLRKRNHIGKSAKRAAKRIKVKALKAVGRFQHPRQH